MRSEDQMIDLIRAVAQKDERIRAVILNGSRTNKNIVKDDFQDFDVIYLVNEIDSFKNEPDWIDVFGQRVILQMPNSMKLKECAPKNAEDEIVYLMLFKDFNRIDLRLVKVKDKDRCQDSLNLVLVDKDQIFDQVSVPSDIDYHIKKPSQKEFSDCCNEFWWVSTYVFKGIARNEPLYAKDMLEGPVRKMFMKMMAWYAASKEEYSINTGANYRFLKDYIEEESWNRVIKTYPDGEIKSIWTSLNEMTKLFHEVASILAKDIELTYDSNESENVRRYLSNRKSKIPRLKEL